MQPASRLLILLLILALPWDATAGDLYRWVDKDGRVTYSDQLPPADAQQAERRNLRGNVVEVDKYSSAARSAARQYPVTLWASDCGPPCVRARALLAKRGVPYASRDPQNNPEDSEALRKLTGRLQVPTLQVGRETPLEGLEEGAWNRLLDVAGYPANGAVAALPAPNGKSPGSDKPSGAASPGRAAPGDSNALTPPVPVGSPPPVSPQRTIDPPAAPR